MEMDWQKLLFHLSFSFPLPLTTEFLLLGAVTDAAYIGPLSTSLPELGGRIPSAASMLHMA